MAIATTHGDQVDLGNGVIRSYVKITDISSAAELLAAVAGFKIRPVAGYLDIGAAGVFEIKSGSKICHYGKMPSAGNFSFVDGGVLPGGEGEALSIEGSAAVSCDGWIEWVAVK